MTAVTSLIPDSLPHCTQHAHAKFAGRPLLWPRRTGARFRLTVFLKTILSRASLAHLRQGPQVCVGCAELLFVIARMASSIACFIALKLRRVFALYRSFFADLRRVALIAVLRVVSV